jgi:hypothetical protein
MGAWRPAAGAAVPLKLMSTKSLLELAYSILGELDERGYRPMDGVDSDAIVALLTDDTVSVTDERIRAVIRAGTAELARRAADGGAKQVTDPPPSDLRPKAIARWMLPDSADQDMINLTESIVEYAAPVADRPDGPMTPAMYLARVEGLVSRTARALWERHVQRSQQGGAK